jgi:hypothetical protein
MHEDSRGPILEEMGRSPPYAHSRPLSIEEALVNQAPSTHDPKQTLDWIQIVKSSQYLLTDPCQFDILQSGLGWRGSNAI